jgi:hypothetical protein
MNPFFFLREIGRLISRYNTKELGQTEEVRNLTNRGMS